MPVGADLIAAIKEFTDLSGPLLVATDFDGVLAPLQDDPAKSRPLPQSSRALTHLVGARDGQISVAFVSGRQLSELVEYAQPAPGSYLFGTHGAQSGRIDDSGQLIVTELEMLPEKATALEVVSRKAHELAATADGSWVENKKTAVVLHTRLATEQDAVRIESEFRSFVESSNLHVISGHDVTEVSATNANKGLAVSQLRNDLKANAVVYLGDDVTDETVFSTLNGSDIGIKVGSGETAAKYRIDSPEDAAFILATIAGMVAKDL